MLSNLLTFALHSPKRLALVVVGSLLLLVLVGRVLSPAAPDTATPTPTPTPTVTPAATHTPLIPADIPSAPARVAPSARATVKATPVPVPRDMVALGTQFVKAWSNHKAGKRWFPALRPMVTAKLAGGLRYTDVRNVPATRVIGPAIVEQNSPVIIGVPTDAGIISVTIVQDAQDWKIDRVIR